MKSDRAYAGEYIYLDNMPFIYEPLSGLFKTMSMAFGDNLRLEDIRRRGMVMSQWEMASVDGVPYLYNEERDTFYRLGNSEVRLSSDEYERKDRQGLVEYPWGEPFRKVVERERRWAAQQQDCERDR